MAVVKWISSPFSSSAMDPIEVKWNLLHQTLFSLPPLPSIQSSATMLIRNGDPPYIHEDDLRMESSSVGKVPKEVSAPLDPNKRPDQLTEID